MEANKRMRNAWGRRWHTIDVADFNHKPKTNQPIDKSTETNQSTNQPNKRRDQSTELILFTRPSASSHR
jgi:hypothetical protein